MSDMPDQRVIEGKAEPEDPLDGPIEHQDAGEIEEAVREEEAEDAIAQGLAGPEEKAKHERLVRESGC